MAIGFLTDEIKITTAAPTAAGTSAITATGLDMAGWDGVVFIVRLGTPAVDNNIRVQQETTLGGTYADLVGTLVGNHATDSPLIVDFRRPQEEFLRVKITRGTSTTIDSCVAIQYRARTHPASQPSGTQLEKHLAEAEGTA